MFLPMPLFLFLNVTFLPKCNDLDWEIRLELLCSVWQALDDGSERHKPLVIGYPPCKRKRPSGGVPENQIRIPAFRNGAQESLKTILKEVWCWWLCSVSNFFFTQRILVDWGLLSLRFHYFLSGATMTYLVLIDQSVERTPGAPELPDGICLSLLEWRSRNLVAIAFGRCIFTWNAMGSFLSRCPCMRRIAQLNCKRELGSSFCLTGMLILVSKFSG